MSKKKQRFNKWNPPEFIHRIGALYETKYGWAVSHKDTLYLNKDCDIGYGTYIQAKYKVFIGRNVQIGAHCLIYSYDSERDLTGPVYIENDVVIGAQTIIFPNTHIKPKTKIKAQSILDGGVYT